jgi:hypothetical protein
MAATAQDSTVPLRGGDGKVKDDDLEDGKRLLLFNLICSADRPLGPKRYLILTPTARTCS